MVRKVFKGKIVRKVLKVSYFIIPTYLLVLTRMTLLQWRESIASLELLNSMDLA